MGFKFAVECIWNFMKYPYLCINKYRERPFVFSKQFILSNIESHVSILIHLYVLSRKKYVEQQLAKRLGKELPDEAAKASKRPKTLDELALEASVPKIKEIYSEPGAAFVAGVTEVPLGVEHKLKNIEATEAAKMALLVKGGNAARARGGFLEEDGEEGYGAGGGGDGCKRGNFPVRFGKMNEKEKNVLADVAAKKAAQKARFLEKKEKKQNDFKGFF